MKYLILLFTLAFVSLPALAQQGSFNEASVQLVAQTPVQKFYINNGSSDVLTMRSIVSVDEWGFPVFGETQVSVLPGDFHIIYFVVSTYYYEGQILYWATETDAFGLALEDKEPVFTMGSAIDGMVAFETEAGPQGYPIRMDQGWESLNTTLDHNWAVPQVSDLLAGVPDYTLTPQY